MAKTPINSTKRHSLADKYLLKMLSDTKFDFKVKRLDLIKVKQNFIDENEQDFICLIHDEELNKKIQSSS